MEIAVEIYSAILPQKQASKVGQLRFFSYMDWTFSDYNVSLDTWCMCRPLQVKCMEVFYSWENRSLEK